MIALDSQRVDRDAVELIVVDNGSSDTTSEVLSSMARRSRLPLQPLTEREPGASAARNAALAVARNEVVLFMGDDTVPESPDLLASHLALHTRRPEAGYGVLGHIAWAPHLNVTPLMSWLEQGAQFSLGAIEDGVAGPEHFYTAHVSVKRSLIEEVGAFDRRLPFLFEDLEMGTRLARAGMVLEYRPELVVHHDHPIALRQWRRRQQTAGRSARRLLEIEASMSRFVPRPRGPRWAAVRLLARPLAAARSEWRFLPRAVRESAYYALHTGAYAEGYRAARSGGDLGFDRLVGN